MKNSICFICTVLCLSMATHAVELYVDPAGSDTNAGTKAVPLATLDGARSLISKQGLIGEEPVTVWITGGTYSMDQTLCFRESDSGTEKAPVTYRAVPGDEVVLKGSLPVSSNAWKIWKDGIYRQSLKGTALEGRAINQLFMSNERMVRARYPNWDYNNPLRTGKGYLHAGGNKSSMEYIEWEAGALDGRVAQWKHPEQGIVHAFHSKNWGNFQFAIREIDPAKRVIHFSEGGWQAQRRYGVGGKSKGHSEGSPFYIENIFEELDAPYEWFHDPEADMLYFKPPTGMDLSAVTVEAAVIDRIIEVEGAEQLHFDGFNLTQTRVTFMQPYEDLARGDWAIHRGGAVYFKDSQNCTVKNFHIEKVGGNGIFVDGFNKDIHISGCLIEDTGESAVCFVGNPKAVREYQTWVSDKKGVYEDLEPGPKTEDYPRDCSVKNSITRDVGVYGKQTSGVLISMAMDITAEHVSVYRIARAGITINDGTWGGHVMAHCDIYDTILDTGEHGPFNSWGRERFWHFFGETKMTKEWVKLDSLKPIVLRNNRVGNYRSAVSAGNWTIDLDDGSSNYEIYNNLMIGSTLKLRDGYFRTVTNNIMVSAVPLGFHVWPADNSEDVFKRNITVVAGAVEGSGRKTSSVLGPVRMPKNPSNWGTFDYNLWWNVNVPDFSAGKVAKSLKAWQQHQGRNSVFADPQFVDPENRNYQVKPGSPALKLGFKNFPMDQFGHQMTRIMNVVHQFEDAVEVVIRADARGGQVHYTVDGSEPTAKSPVYKKPFRIDEHTTVRANTFNAQGHAVGFEDRVAFEKVDQVKHQSWLASLLAGQFVGPEKQANTKAEREPRTLTWLGMDLVTISDFPDYIDASGGQSSGVFVDRMGKDSPALKAGMKEGDTIIRLNTTEVRTLEDFERALKKANGVFSVKVFRNYQHHEFTVEQ
ncbi:chitobiase/beta-hexosaminidase C-terminal domain-containing protein [Pontiellaceae bacterium B12219]|nr:chitobiase/beta-hexosaminidase C-terminal domain-containing protein [Pontiellaceae bacterium B12219]